MKDNNDVSKLFEEIGGNATTYREITRADRAGAALARWPLLSTLQEDIAKSGSAEDASLLSIPVGRQQAPQPAFESRAVPDHSGVAQSSARETMVPSPLASLVRQAEVPPSAPEPVREPSVREPEVSDAVAQATKLREPSFLSRIGFKRSAESDPQAAREPSFSLADKLSLRPADATPAVAVTEQVVAQVQQVVGLQAVFQRILGDGEVAAVPAAASPSDAGRDEPAASGLTLAQRLNRL